MNLQYLSEITGNKVVIFLILISLLLNVNPNSVVALSRKQGHKASLIDVLCMGKD